MYAFYEKRESPFQCQFVNDFSFPLHLHNQAELVYVESGCMELTIDQETRELHQGEAAICFPNCAHGYRNVGSSRILILIFDVNLTGEFTTAFKQKRPANPFFTADQVHPDFKFIYPSLFKPMENSLLKGYLLVIFSHFFGEMHLVSEAYSPSSDLIHSALQYVIQHFLEPLSLERVAKELGVSKYHLSRIFSKRIGTSFNEYINILRADHARMLLTDTDKSITQVGFDSGFESSSSFYRIFKAQCGVTPSQYRRKQISKDVLKRSV